MLGLLRHALIPTKVHPMYFQKTYFIKWTRTRTRTKTFRKTDPATLEKMHPVPTLIVLLKNFLLTNLRVLISNRTLVFKKYSPNKTILELNFLLFFVLQKILQFNEFEDAYSIIIIVFKCFSLKI